MAEIHVGDNATTYSGKIQDDGAPFDPTTATTKKLIFSTPLGTLERGATVVHPDEDPDWYLEYTLVPGEDDDFHSVSGLYKWQGYVEFAGGAKYHTTIASHVVVDNL